MIIFPFKMLPLRKARLSQQTACLVIHDKTSLWMTNEASFTSLHSTRVISDCVRWGQNSHLTLLIWVAVPLKGEGGECWVKCCLHARHCDAREIILLIQPSCLVLRPAENAASSHAHFRKGVQRETFLKTRAVYSELWKCCSFHARPVKLYHQGLF